MSVRYAFHQEHREIREAVAQLCSQFSLEYWDEHERDGVFPEEFYRAFADGGWLGASTPVEYGGSGLPISALAAILEEVAASGGALDACASVHIPLLTVPVLLRHGTPEQCHEMIPRIVAGELFVSFGVTEPTAGTDTTRISTFARRRGDEYVISGQKVWNSGALRAEKVLLVTRTEHRDEANRASGITLFLVDLDSDGIGIQPIPKISRNAVKSCELFLDEVVVPADRVVGEVGKGFSHLLTGLNGERLLLSAECLGLGRWCVEQSARYACERSVFGRPIGANQSVQHPITEGYLKLLAASHVLEAGLEAFEAGADSDQIGALTNSAKFLASEACYFAADQAFQTFGGYSFAREYHVGRHWAQCRLQRVAPVANQLVLNYLAERVLDLPRSY
jgi:acyl-CoA dehydrogenase